MSFDDFSASSAVAAEAPVARPSPALYERFASCYDALYRFGLQPGRDRAVAQMALAGGERILEVGVGTGLSALQYPRHCDVVAIDLSAEMLARAQVRLERSAIAHVRLCRMNGAQLAFADDQFDVVYAPYFINTVPEPAAVAREMLRVCRPQGRLVFLNHFRERELRRRPLDAVIGRVATQISGVNWQLDLTDFLQRLPVTILSFERVNLAGVSSVLVCSKP